LFIILVDSYPWKAYEENKESQYLLRRSDELGKSISQRKCAAFGL